MNDLTTFWRSRFNIEFTDEEIDQRTAITPQPLSSLAELPVEVAESKLDVALRAHFVPSSQSRAILRQLHALCRCYSEQRYPDQVAFLRNVHAIDAEHGLFEPPLRITCLTGLPGIGKSKVISAFEQLFRPTSIAIPAHGTFLLRPSWRMTVKAGSSLRQLVADHFRHPEALSSRPSFPTIQRELCTQGVTSLHADELQFLTQGEGNILPAKLLNQLGRLGPPLVFAANYSLIHRLNSRPQEEKQRLLAKPLFLHPDPASSDDWCSFIRALIGTASEFGKLVFQDTQLLLHSYTFGLRRLAAMLLTQSYVEMRRRNGKHVELTDIDSAYSSRTYAASRSDVEILVANLEKTGKGRKDLWCPLQGADPAASNPAKVVQHPATQAYEQRLSQAALVSSMTPSERLRSGLTERGEPRTPKPRAMPKPKATGKALLEGAAALNATLKPKR